jgi:hypothetical protein
MMMIYKQFYDDYSIHTDSNSDSITAINHYFYKTLLPYLVLFDFHDPRCSVTRHDGGWV